MSLPVLVMFVGWNARLIELTNAARLECVAGLEKVRVPALLRAVDGVSLVSNNSRSSYLGVQVRETQKNRHLMGKSTALGGSARAEIYLQEAGSPTAVRYVENEDEDSGSVPTTQKGWTYSEYGAAKQVLKFEDSIPVPQVEPDEVLVAVKAAALNPVDCKRRLGKFQSTDSPLPVCPILHAFQPFPATSPSSHMTIFVKGNMLLLVCLLTNFCATACARI